MLLHCVVLCYFAFFIGFELHDFVTCDELRSSSGQYDLVLCYELHSPCGQLCECVLFPNIRRLCCSVLMRMWGGEGGRRILGGREEGAERV